MIGNGVNPFVRNLRNVQQTVFTRQQLHDGTEVQQTHHRAFVDATNFDFGNDILNTFLGGFTGFAGDAGDADIAFIVDVDLRAGFARQRLDHATALADDFANLVGIDFHLDDLRRELRKLATCRRHCLFHEAKNMHAAFFGLL